MAVYLVLFFLSLYVCVWQFHSHASVVYATLCCNDSCIYQERERKRDEDFQAKMPENIFAKESLGFGGLNSPAREWILGVFARLLSFDK